MQLHIMNDWKFTYFLLAVVYLYFIKMAPDKSSNRIVLGNTDTWFIIEHHFHPIIHPPWLYFIIGYIDLIFFCLRYCRISYVFLSFHSFNFIQFSTKPWLRLRPFCFSFDSSCIFSSVVISLQVFSLHALMPFSVYQYIFLFFVSPHPTFLVY